jgi:hypothetical protein
MKFNFFLLSLLFLIAKQFPAPIQNNDKIKLLPSPSEISEIEEMINFLKKNPSYLEVLKMMKNDNDFFLECRNACKNLKIKN